MKTVAVLAIAALVVLTVALCATALFRWNRPPVFLRYHGTQPPLTLALLANSAEKDSVPHVVQAAKQYYAPSNDYWSEPVEVSERDTFWWVKFKIKERVVRRHGVELVQTAIPGGVCIQVEKADLSCRLVPAR